MAEEWVEIAEIMAKHYELPTPLLKAMVDAESEGRNVAGDFLAGVPRAFGFGQIWPKWHREAILLVGRELGAAVGSEDSDATLGQKMLEDPYLSMAVTAVVLKKYWDQSAQDFDQFLRTYIGHGVSWQETMRRRKLLEKWQSKKEE